MSKEPETTDGGEDCPECDAPLDIRRSWNTLGEETTCKKCGSVWLVDHEESFDDAVIFWVKVRDCT